MRGDPDAGTSAEPYKPSSNTAVLAVAFKIPSCSSVLNTSRRLNTHRECGRPTGIRSQDVADIAGLPDAVGRGEQLQDRDQPVGWMTTFPCSSSSEYDSPSAENCEA